MGIAQRWKLHGGLEIGIGDSLVEPLAAAPDPRSRPAPG